MHDPTKSISNLVAAFIIQSDELPVIHQCINQASIVGGKFTREGSSCIIYLNQESESAQSEVQRSQFAAAVFILVCLSEVTGSKFRLYIKSSYAAKLDQVPLFYRPIWIAAFDGVKHNVKALAK